MENTTTTDTGSVRLRVAVAQNAPTCGDITGNLQEIENLLATVSTADLVITPELAVPGFAFAPDQVPPPMDADDPRLTRLARPGQALSLGIAETAPAGRPYDSAVLIGEDITVQRKTHLVSYDPWNEHEIYSPGDRIVPATIKGVRTATLICNDVWHPVMPWLAVQSGAEVLIVPAASMGPDTEHSSAQTWQTILTQMARTLQCFVVFANRAGTDDGNPFWGGSRVLGPEGELLAQATDQPGTIQADLDITHLRDLRRRIPLLAEARPDLVMNELRALKAGEILV